MFRCSVPCFVFVWFLFFLLELVLCSQLVNPVPPPYLTVLSSTPLPLTTSATPTPTPTPTPTSAAPASSSCNYMNTTQITFNYAMFGPLVRQGGIRGPILIPIPQTGCSIPSATATNGLPIAGGIVLVMRQSACNFATQALNLRAANASVMVSYACSPLAGCSASRVFPAASNVAPNIPTINLDWQTGSALQTRIALNCNVTVYIPGSGPIVSRDRSALSDLFSSLTVNGPMYYYNKNLRSSPTLADKSGGLNTWDMLNATFPDAEVRMLDPCVNRAFGIACVDGRVVQVVCNNCQSTGGGALAASIGNMDQLGTLNLNGQQLVGSIPESLTQIYSLSLLDLGSNSFTSLPSSVTFSSLVSLVSFTASFNQLINFPDSIWSLPLIQSIAVSTNKIYADLSKATKSTTLFSIDISFNHFIGSLPVMNSSTFPLLSSLLVNNNQLSGTLLVNHFDGLSQLTTISVANNNFAGGIPRMAAATLLATADFSFNSFSGSVTSLRCTDLTSLNTLYIQHNFLNSPCSLASCPALQTLDGSYNLFVSDTGDPALFGLSGAFVTRSVPNSITSLSFAGNRISGGWGAGVGTLLINMVSVNVSANYITNMPPDLWTMWPKLKMIDMSSNHLSGDVPSGFPSPLFKELYLSLNPSLLSSSSISNYNLPPFLAASLTMVVDVTGTFQCRAVVGARQAIITTLDNTYSKYALCQCQVGFFGSPPKCLPFATDIYLDVDNITNSNTVTSANAAHGLLTDGTFTGRTRPGLETYWHLSSTQPSTVGFLLNFSYVSLSDANRDHIDIWDNLNSVGNTLYSFSESSPPSLLSPLFIPSSNLSVLFSSHASVGLHFQLSYTTTAVYPIGYLPPPYAVNDALFIACLVIVSFTCVVLVSVFLVLYRHRHNKLLLASSPVFNYMSLVGALCSCLSSLVYAFPPHTFVDCQVRIWLLPFSLSALLTPLLVKTYRLHRIFNSRLLVQSTGLRTSELIVGVMLVNAPIAIILLATTWTDGAAVHVTGVSASLGNYVVDSCTFSVSQVVPLLVYMFSLALTFTFLAVRVRHIPAAFNEAVHICISICFFSLSAAIIIPLNFLVSYDPSSLIILRTFGCTLTVWLVVGAIFIPKLMSIANGESLVDAMQMGSTNTRYVVEPVRTRAAAAAGLSPVSPVQSGPSARPPVKPNPTMISPVRSPADANTGNSSHVKQAF